MIFTGSLLMVIVVSISGLQPNPFAMWWASAESLPQTSVRDPSSGVFSFCFVLRRTDCCGHFSLLHRWDFMAFVGNREWLVFSSCGLATFSTYKGILFQALDTIEVEDVGNWKDVTW